MNAPLYLLLAAAATLALPIPPASALAGEVHATGTVAHELTSADGTFTCSGIAAVSVTVDLATGSGVLEYVAVDGQAPVPFCPSGVPFVWAFDECTGSDPGVVTCLRTHADGTVTTMTLQPNGDFSAVDQLPSFETTLNGRLLRV